VLTIFGFFVHSLKVNFIVYEQKKNEMFLKACFMLYRRENKVIQVWNYKIVSKWTEFNSSFYDTFVPHDADQLQWMITESRGSRKLPILNQISIQTDVFQTLHDSHLCLTAVLRVWCDRLASLAVPCVGGNAFWLHYSVLSTCEALTTWYTSTRCKSCPVLGV